MKTTSYTRPFLTKTSDRSYYWNQIETTQQLLVHLEVTSPESAKKEILFYTDFSYVSEHSKQFEHFLHEGGPEASGRIHEIAHLRIFLRNIEICEIV